MLLSLLNHPDLSVRTWAAYYVLPIKEDDAMVITHPLAKVGGL